MKTILIIDDEDRIRIIFKSVIEAMGKDVRVLESDNAVQATGILMREKIDLILLDIQLPTINGQIMYDVIQEYNPTIKVIVASVYPIETQKKMLPFADDYYDKSWGLMKLVEKVKEYSIF
jgi:CheY-like chemotaxis protein